MAKDNGKPEIHLDHRSRVRKKVLTDGTESLTDYGLLELLLFEVLPRRDINGEVHALIDGCGGLAGVMEDGAFEKAKTLTGETGALYLQTLRAVCERYTREAVFTDTVFMSLAEARQTFAEAVGRAAYDITLMTLNERLADPHFYTYPSPGWDDPALAELVSREVLGNQVQFLFVGFGHPGGFLVPLPWETDFIRRLFRVCMLSGTYLAEAVIATEDGARNVSDMCLLAPATFVFRPAEQK